MHFSLFCLLFIAVTGCNDDDVIDELPRATQSGRNTFGCLVNGKPFIPGSIVNPLECYYTFIDGSYYLEIEANMRDENSNILTVAIGTNDLKLVEGKKYELSENAKGKAYAIYTPRGAQTFTNSLNKVELKITKLDEENKIISGAFSFNIIDFEGNQYRITNGRFDLKYKN